MAQKGKPETNGASCEKKKNKTDDDAKKNRAPPVKKYKLEKAFAETDRMTDEGTLGMGGNGDVDGDGDFSGPTIADETKTEKEIATSTQLVQEKKPPPTTTTAKKNSRSPLPRLLIQGTVHLAFIFLYLLPLLQPNEIAGPTLDEFHVMDTGTNKDIHDPSTTLRELFSNDYWGRPMTSPSSHKSWRPLTVLTFRYLKGPYGDALTHGLQQLTVHRLVNVVCHAAVGELVGQLATQLFFLNNDNDNNMLSENENAMWLQLITKIFFCLHPTHVEVAANAANRNHILAVLFGLVLCFPGPAMNSGGEKTIGPRIATTPFWFFFVTLVAGYLASETMIFMIPGIMVTMTVVAFATADRQKRRRNRSYNTNNDGGGGGGASESLSKEWKRLAIDYLHAMITIAPRLILLGASLGIYYGFRLYFETLDIPTGLFRKAENPFVWFNGVRRFKNYLYVVTIHLGKQWGLILPGGFGGDPIGFSHEYGFDCIPEVYDWTDQRLVFGVAFHLFFAIALSGWLVANNPRRFFGPVAMHWSWTLLTLFPISGFLRVGTFVSDRIVVPSTVVASLWAGRLFHLYSTSWFWKTESVFGFFRPLQVVFVLWSFVVSWSTVHNRSLEWMDNLSLITSSLRTCPRYAKAHMEASKLYSGVLPSVRDVSKTRHHLAIAREIDPGMCDLHKQFVFLGIQDRNDAMVEEELPGAVLCRFTSNEMQPLFRRYWQDKITSVEGTPSEAGVKARYAKTMRLLQEGIDAQDAAGEGEID